MIGVNDTHYERCPQNPSHAKAIFTSGHVLWVFGESAPWGQQLETRFFPMRGGGGAPGGAVGAFKMDLHHGAQKAAPPPPPRHWHSPRTFYSARNNKT
eukprot:6479871-Amphidinium_carterae.2